MRRPYAEEILGEWGIRDVTPDSERQRKQLEADREVNPLVGEPLRRRLRIVHPDPDNYIASLGGPLPYMRRLRQIEELTDEHLERLSRRPTPNEGPTGAGSPSAGNFTVVNELIDKHNRWFPIEARLPMDPRSRDFVRIAGRPYRREPLDAAWVLARFP